MNDITSEMKENFLKMGLRVIDFGGMKAIKVSLKGDVIKVSLKGDVQGQYLLVTTKHFPRASLLEGTWDGSYIPLIFYKNGTGVILVGYEVVARWDWVNLTRDISNIVGRNITTRGD